jgi:SAM-dependent methyltransferase
MHLLILLPILIVISTLQLEPSTLSIVYGIIAIVFIPDAILAFRKSPPFVPTFKRDMKTMINLASIKKGDIVVDPGCGDGRLVFAASALGAKAIGIEYSIPAFLYAWVRSLFHKNSRIRFGDLWKQRYGDADVVFCYLLVETMESFEKIIWPQLKPGCRVVSNSFRMKNREPTKTEKGAYLYIK